MQLVVVMAVRKAVSAATITFTAISTIRLFITTTYTIHYSLDLRAALVFIQSFSTVSTFTAGTGADHEGRSLSRHSEATGIDAIVLSQLER